MIGRGLVFGATTAALLSLAACGEKPQATDAAAKKGDAEPWTVSSSATPGFTAAGWTPGDKTSWEEQMRKRNQSQNDYLR